MWVYFATALIALATGFAGGWKVQGWRWGAAEADRITQQRKDEREDRANVDRAAAAHERTREVLRTEFVPINREIERVVTQIEYRDRACLDDDGLRVARAAIAAANRAAGFPAPAVSAPARSP